MNKDELLRIVSEKADTTVLSFEERGPFGDAKYRGNFSGFIPASLIYRYRAKSVSEIFAGSGTTSDVCKCLNLPYIGIDLNPIPVRSDIVSMDILDYSEDLPDGFYTADLQILHPPYPSINGVHYSDHMWKDTTGISKRDIQEMNWEKGMDAINKAVMRGFLAMPKGSYQAVVIGDVRRKINGKSTFKSMLADLCIPGELEQLLVKMQHHTVSGRNNQYTKQRSFFLIEHEFIAVIKKPSGYEISYVVPKRYTSDIRDSVSSATWKDVVFAVLSNLGKEASLEQIYEEIKGHKKTQNNPLNWKAKVRQVLQQLGSSGLAINTQRGYWAIAV